MKRLALAAVLLAAPAAVAGDVKVRIDVNAGWQFPGNAQRRGPVRAWVPRGYVPPVVWYVPPAPTVVVAPPPPPEPPQVIVIEREVAPPVASPPPPPPQVVVVQVAPEPLAPPPPPVTIVPVAPAVPGPDVYSWTDDDGVVHYSTRVPADAKKRAKKLK